jgi:hypothetical protein
LHQNTLAEQTLASQRHDPLDEDIIVKPGASMADTRSWMENDHIPSLGLPTAQI